MANKRIDELELINNIENEDLIPIQTKSGTKSIKANNIVGSTYTEGEIYINELRDDESETTYWLVNIPHLDKNGNLIKLKTGVSQYYENNPCQHDDDGYGTNYHLNPKLETARHFANRKNATICINGGVWGNTGAIGDYVVNGEIKNSDTSRWNQLSLGIKADNTLVDYGHTVTAQQMIDDGCVDVISGFFPIMRDGEVVPDSIKNLYGVNGANWLSKHPRTVIGQKANKDIVFIVTSGRLPNEAGMTMDDCVRLLTDNDCVFGYYLDGGGSSSLVYKGNYINTKVDGNGFWERNLFSFIYVDCNNDSEINKDIMDTNNRMGELRSMIQDVIREMYCKTDFNLGYIRLKSDSSPLIGIESWHEGTKNTKMVMNKEYLQYWDYVNGQTIFRADSNSTITTPHGDLARFFDRPEKIKDLNDISKSGIYWGTANTTANMPHDEISCCVIHIQIDDVNKMQIAFNYTIDAEKKCYTRRNVAKQDQWYDWI